MFEVLQHNSPDLPYPHHQRLDIDTNKAEQLIANLAARGPRSHGATRLDSRPVAPRVQRRTPSTLDNKRRDSMLAARGRDVRRERTFVGGECAVCEEPLEHTLRGERILQLLCGHVAHQACFFEYTKELETHTPQCPTCDAPLGLDPSRGVAADFDNLHRMVRAAGTPDPGAQHDFRPMTADTWNPEAILRNEKPLPPVHESRQETVAVERGRLAQDWIRDAQNARRHPSANTDIRDKTGNQEFDVVAIENGSTRTPPPSWTRAHVPTPVVTVRSEYPTLSKSKHQQSLTCVVTVEVLPGKAQHIYSHGEQIDPTHSPTKPQSKSGSTKSASQHTAEPSEDAKQLSRLRDELFVKVENWHGLDYTRFGKLLLHGVMRVGKDKQSWQELECYLFTQMLICVKEKKSASPSQEWTAANGARSHIKYALKGSILIKKHLQHVQYIPEQLMLSLSLSVVELPYFHLQFNELEEMNMWRTALLSVEKSDPADSLEHDRDPSGTDDEATTDEQSRQRRLSTLRSSSHGRNRSPTTAPTDYTSPWSSRPEVSSTTGSNHVPVDVVVVVPVSASTHGLKSTLLRDALQFLVANLGNRDRLALVTFGSSAGGATLTGMNTKAWNGWSGAIDQIRPEPGKNQRADVVDGANVAMDLLMQRKVSNPLSSILLISDSAVSDVESVDFVVSRAEAAKITVHSFGLGLTHKPDTMVELSTRTKGAYTFVKDWMMLRECLAGCLGALQSISHQNVKVKLHLPEGSPAKFVKISGALHITKRAAGRDADASIGDLRFGDKRDILVQLAIPSDGSAADSPTSDPWEHIISNLEALGGTIDSDSLRGFSVEEMPLLQADLAWGDVLRDGTLTHLPRQSLLAITMLPSAKRGTRSTTPPIPPHPSVVQRRMELLTSDMLTRALTLTSREQHDRAKHLLVETRSILQGLSKGGLPPLPPNPARMSKVVNTDISSSTAADVPLPEASHRTPTPPRELTAFAPGAGIDQGVIAALDHDLESSLEYISHPQVFIRDSHKAVLQAIGVISSQRGFTYRSPAETLWASRIPGISRLLGNSQDWREQSEHHIMPDS